MVKKILFFYYLGYLLYIHSSFGTGIDKIMKQKGESNSSVFSFMVGASSFFLSLLPHVYEVFPYTKP